MPKYYQGIIVLVLLIYVSLITSILPSYTPLILMIPWVVTYGSLVELFIVAFLIFLVVFVSLWYVYSRWLSEMIISNKIYPKNLMASAGRLGISALSSLLVYIFPNALIIFIIFAGSIEVLNWFFYTPMIDDIINPTCLLIFFLPYLYLIFIPFFIAIYYAVAVITLFYPRKRWIFIIPLNLGLIMPFYIFLPNLFYIAIIIAFSYSTFKNIPTLIINNEKIIVEFDKKSI